MRYLFIVNPVAGGKRNHHEKLIEEIDRLMAEKSEEYEVYVTKAPLDACEKIKLEAEKGDEMCVVACGGDGTLNECVNGAMPYPNCALSHYPCGTGNDFIKMFDGESKRFFELGSIVNGDIYPIDVIKCNDRYSINICSVGIDARIGTDVHKYSNLPVIGGSVGYVVSLIVNLFKGISSHMRIKTPDDELEGEYTLVCACNGRYYGGGFNPVPEARPDDGSLDFLIVNKVSVLKFISAVTAYAKGKYKTMPDVIKKLSGERLDVYSDEEFVINIDGEVQRSKHAHWEVIKKGLRFMFPKNMKFFNMRTEKIGAN